MRKAAVITCSDRAAASVYEDRSGPIVREALLGLGFDTPEVTIVPDHADEITRAIRDALDVGARVVLTTGGTGIGPSDLTVEVTRGLIEYEIPGLMEEVRRVGAQNEPRALLSRGIAGVVFVPGRRHAFIANAPGSRGGARDTIAVLGPLLVHIVEQLDGVDHPMDPIEPASGANPVA